MVGAIGLATGVLVACTLLPLWRHPHWFVRGMEFPRLQLACVAAFALLAQIVLLDRGDVVTWAFVAATLPCVVWHVWWIAPYTRVWPVEVKGATDTGSDGRLRIVTANVLTPNRNAEALIALVRQLEPDVLLTLESDRWWEAELDVLQDDMPHTIKCPLDNLYGMHLYSRLPLRESEIVYLVEDDVPSIHTLVALRTGEEVRMHCLHPAPPSPTENTESAERDAELVIVAGSINGEQPTIVTGDLNDVAWSATTRLFRKLSGLLDPRVGRGMFNTFHANYPFMRWPLDHLFHSEHFTLSGIRRLPPIGSDHFALLTELSYTPPHRTDQSGLDATSRDRAWARSIASTKNASRADVPRPGAG